MAVRSWTEGSSPRRARRGPVPRFGLAGLATVTGLAVMMAAEALAAARRHYLDPDSAPDADGGYGDAADPVLRLALLGDSTAAGVGARQRIGTVGAQLATLLAADGRRVELTDFAVSGSRTRDLMPQVSRALLGRPDVAVVLVGANDATHLEPLRSVRSAGVAALGRLQDAGVAVVLGTCPDLGAARALAQPLRALAGWRGRRVADSQQDAAGTLGVVTVDLAALTGPAFRRDAATFADDAFHPSAAGYQLWAAALLPAVREVAAVHLPS